MQRNSKYTAAIILGSIGISISVAVSILFLIQYIPIHIRTLDSVYTNPKPRFWFKIGMIFAFPIFGGIQAIVGISNKRGPVVRRSINIISASMGLITSLIVVSMNYVWGGFYFSSDYRLILMTFAIGTVITFFCFLGSGLLLIQSENCESRSIKLESSKGVYMIGIGLILALICSSCIAAGIYREKQLYPYIYLTFGELNFLAVLGFLAFIGVFITIYGLFLSRKRVKIGVLVIIAGSIWLQVYQNAFLIWFWDPVSYGSDIEYMYLIEMLSVVHIIFIMLGIGAILSDNYRPKITENKPIFLYLCGAFDL
ncbi:MAG: hypothetical protein ACTSRE_14625, partial [Promethearchaeota archaeon]